MTVLYHEVHENNLKSVLFPLLTLINFPRTTFMKTCILTLIKVRVLGVAPAFLVASLAAGV